MKRPEECSQLIRVKSPLARYPGAPPASHMGEGAELGADVSQHAGGGQPPTLLPKPRAGEAWLCSGSGPLTVSALDTAG